MKKRMFRLVPNCDKWVLYDGTTEVGGNQWMTFKSYEAGKAICDICNAATTSKSGISLLQRMEEDVKARTNLSANEK